MDFENTENTQELSTEVSSEDPNQGQTAEQLLIDIEQYEKFRVDGQEMTRAELRAHLMRQSDYTRKQQALAEERQKWGNFTSNFRADVDNVRNNPQLYEQFKKVYPKEFHALLDKEISETHTRGTPSGNQVDQALEQRLAKYDQYIEQTEAKNHEVMVQSIGKELESLFSEKTKQYNFADEEAVIARAQTLLGVKEQEGDKTPITPDQWDKIFKSVHEGNLNRFKAYQGSLVKGQKEANERSKDMGAGGGIPGQAPKQARTIKEATDQLMQHWSLEA